QEAIKALRRIEVDSAYPERYDKQCLDLESALLRTNATLVPFSGKTPFQILNLQLKKRNTINWVFLQKLGRAISGLRDILKLQEEGPDSSQSHLGFASDLLSLDKIKNLSTPKVSSLLPEERLNRIKDCYTTLKQTQKAYTDSCITCFSTSRFAEDFSLERLLTEVKLEVVTDNPCGTARKIFRKEIDAFTRTIAALRLAELEISQEYEKEIHVPYFEGFDTSYLSEDDIQYFRTLVVMEESQQLSVNPKDLLSILSDNALVKVLAINRIEDLQKTTNPLDEEETYLELASLAIFRRNAYVYQGSTHTYRIAKAMEKGLHEACPVLWNILIPNPGEDNTNNQFIALKAAMESRYFPHLEYDIETGVDFGSHFNLEGNPQPEVFFPSYEQTIQAKTGNRTVSYSLTTADFLALAISNLDLLEIIPTWYQGEELIPLDEYLNQPTDATIGKVPYIWMVNEEHVLHRVAIPLSWIQLCRARLDYWRFLQELGGVRSTHLQQVVEKAKSEWQKNKEEEIEQLKASLKDEFDRTRSNDLEKGLQRILYSFLDPDKKMPIIFDEPKPSIMTMSDEKQQGVVEQSDPDPEKKETVIRSEVWIESDFCTSCNDCIEAVPGVFKYNSDKQAVVHNPTGGSYPKIVAAAEKCPAKCIHPGLPLDSSEKGMDKWIKRAEKYN
ncbi:MAG: ferredoxin, partial [Bacteroidia bacterium]|nr:ferredoxin [Bacteroidia bacterium]